MKKTLAVLALVLALAPASPVFADSIYLNVGASGSYVLGEAFTRLDIAGGGGALSDSVIMTNALVGMGLNTRTDIAGQPEYYRSANNFGTLPTAVAEGGDFKIAPFDRVDNWIRFTSHPFAYLVGSYDGPNGGTQVWYIANIPQDTIIYIPAYAYPSGTPQNLVDGGTNQQYFMTGWEMLNRVPDGGSVAMLLGAALVGLAGFRRFVK